MSSRMCRGYKISLTLFGASSPDYHPCCSGIEMHPKSVNQSITITQSDQLLSSDQPIDAIRAS